AIAWAAYQMNASMPYWPINPSIGRNPVFQFDLDLLRAFWVVLPGALLWGASFPLAIGAAANEGEDTGHLVGRIYAANTVGAIVGALLTSLMLVAWIGTQKSQQVLIAVSALSGLLMLLKATRRSIAAMLVMILAGAGAGLLMRTVPPLPGILVAYGRYAATWVGINEI